MTTLPTRGVPRLLFVNRAQLLLRTVDVEKLIADDHPARAIWEFVGRLDLSRYRDAIKAVAGEPGRPAYDPHLLISLWVYAYSEGVGSAREIERRCEYHPAYQWLTGMDEINHHTLSDFRIGNQQALDELFTQILGLLSAEKLITLARVMHDGTKVKAVASSKSFRREETLRKHLELARQQVQAMGDPRQDEEQTRVAAARRRAAIERQAALERALAELPKVRAIKRSVADRAAARVSETDPEARVMKQGGGGFAPSYNVQFTTDAAHGIIVTVKVGQEGTDRDELTPAVEQVEARLGVKPRQVVVDSNLTTRANIIAMADQKVDLIGSWPDTAAISEAVYQQHGTAPEFRAAAFTDDAATNSLRCPAGKTLRHNCRSRTRQGLEFDQYLARGEDCAACELRPQCCPRMTMSGQRGRIVVRPIETPAVRQFRDKMEGTEAKAIYRQRSEVAEFTNAWIKVKNGLRQFHLRGLIKTGMEARWVAMTCNIQHWIRLSWRPRYAAGMG